MTKDEYSAENLERMRSLIKLLYLYTEKESVRMSPYELHDIAEKMLNTYIMQGVTYADLSALFTEKLKKEHKDKP